MANFGNSNILANQRRRNFIYQPAASRTRDRGAIDAQPLAETSSALFRAAVPNATDCSPYKRLKISDDSLGERAEQFAAEEACRDLPVDTFDEELGAIDEEFDDDLLTAEQLDECDRIASIELQTQERYPAKFTSNLPQTDVSGNEVPSSLHGNPDEFFSDDEDDSLATNCTQAYTVCQISTTTTPSKVQTTSSSMAGFPGSDPRIMQPAFVTLPRESNRANVVTPNKLGDILVESFVDQSRGSNSFIPATNVAVTGIIETAILASNNHSNYVAKVDHSEDRQMQSMRKEIEQLRADFQMASAKVKTLEEERFCKDGEIRILRDSLRHFEDEEKRRQGEVKAQEIQRTREQSQREKDLEKQVDNLTTQLKFKDREISQMIERNKKRASSSTEPCSPAHKKFVNLSEVFPTGNSFFQKTSPEGNVKSPRGIKSGVKDLRSPGKQNSQRLSEAENSENSGLSGTLSEASSVGKLKTHQRQLCPQGSLDVDLVQNLLSPQDKESHVPFQNPDNRATKDGSIISLLALDTPANYARNNTQRTAVSETDASSTLHLFDTQATSRLKKSIEDVMQKDSSTSTHNNSLVVETLTSLLNQSHMKSLEDNKSTPSSRLSHNYNLPAATNFLPLLESHIVHFVESRTDTNEENIPATCLARHSPTPDSPDSKHSLGFESDQVKNLAVLQDNALIALRLLNILVLYSSEVCDCILKSARVFNQTDSNQGETNKEMDTAEEREKIFSSGGEEDGFCQHPLFPTLKIAIKKDPHKQSMNIRPEEGSEEKRREVEVIQHTELLGYLFRLLMTQPKESTALTYATLQVLNSLARNCEVNYCTRLLPLLSDNLLSEYLSRNWCLTSLSLVIALLTPMTRHIGMVKTLCSRSDGIDCILLKIYQALLFRPDDVPAYYYQVVHFQIISFVDNLLSHSEASMVLFPLESDCHCSLELIKCLVLMLNEVLNSLGQLPLYSLSTDTVNSHSLMLLRRGVFLLATLCLNDRLFVEHRVDVEHQYVNVVSNVTRLYKRITGLISEAEVLAVQDLVDFEHIDGIEWSPESDDEVDETVEGMDVDE